jgi:hypothetical protein
MQMARRRGSSSSDSGNGNGGAYTGAPDVSADAEPIPGVDHTENVQPGFVNLGDGSEEKPHNVVPAQTWHHNRA